MRTEASAERSIEAPANKRPDLVLVLVLAELFSLPRSSPRAPCRWILQVGVVCLSVGVSPFSIALKQDQDLYSSLVHVALSRLLFSPFPGAGRSETANAGSVRISGQIWFVSV